MPYASGLDAVLTVAEESTYGTPVTVTRSYEMVSESIRLQREVIESKGLRAGRLVVGSNRRTVNRKGAEGDLEMEVNEKGMGLWFKHALGSVVTTTPGGATLSRLHTCTLGDTVGRMLTVQVGRPDSAGTVQPFTYAGVKIASWEVACDVDGVLMLKMGVDARDESTVTALATAAYPTAPNLPFTALTATYTLGGSPIDVSKFSIKGDNALKTDRYFMSATSTLKKNPQRAGRVEVTGEVEVEFTGLTDYGRFTSGTPAAFVATFTGGLIEAGHNYSVTITCPAVMVDGETPNVDGEDMIRHALSFTVMDDGTNPPITVAVKNTDTAA